MAPWPNGAASLDGEIPLVRAVNGLFGKLRFEGNPLQNVWALPTLGAFLEIAASVNKGKSHD
jgi:hypothetical protein